MYKKAYQCECGKLYSIKFKGKLNQVCQKCGGNIEDTESWGCHYRSRNLKKVTVYRKYFWKQWKELENEK